MAEYILENDLLRVKVASKGCEIVSVVNKKTKREYMWCGNPDAWKRHAPVLFPLVGRYKNDESIYDGKTYHMTQHGFARDMEFSMVSSTETSLEMRLVKTQETKMKFPFNFSLTLGYQLEGSTIKAAYKVENPNETEMYFSIGGHPAFAAPADYMNLEGQATAAGCELMFETGKEKEQENISQIEEKAGKIEQIRYALLSKDGLLLDQLYDMKLTAGRVVITDDFFDRDALIVEKHQCHKLSLLENGKKYVTVEFDAPVFGLWSAAKKHVPFVCIEPWYGRTDRNTFMGELCEREWGNCLEAGETFSKEYAMTFWE